MLLLIVFRYSYKFWTGLRWEDGERSLAFTLHTGKKQIRFQFFVPFGYPDDKSPDERPTLMQEDGLHDVLNLAFPL